MPDEFQLWLKAHGLPTPMREWRVCSGRRWRYDYAFLAAKVAVEVEGGIWTKGRHTRGKGYLSDMEKYNTAAILGWTVLRFTPDQLLTSETLETLVKALAKV
jgi:very-short-patch-repair endonuclease